MSSTDLAKMNGRIENGHPPRRQSLVKDAQLQCALSKAAKEDWKRDLTPQDSHLTEEEIILLSQLPKDESTGNILASLIFSETDELFSLPQILKGIEICSGRIKHLETRPSRNTEEPLDVLVQLSVEKSGLLNLLKSVRQNREISVSLMPDETQYLRGVWFPRNVSDLDKCNHILSKCEPNLDSSHPGFSDPIYQERRKEITKIAFNYKQGQSIPRVDYTEEEIKTWSVVYKKLSKLYPVYACSAYLQSFNLLEEDCVYTPVTIPQLQDVSMFLKKKTGFTLRPAAGLISARDFLASLAFRVFQCTQYIRHSSCPDHTPEPDCIHELLGHVPMLADPAFAAFSQEIGLASLGASDQDIEKLSTIYWFTVEFGLCKEEDQIKAYGAGLLSSYGELLHAVSEKPQLLEFEPQVTAVQPYQDLLYQNVYFVAQSFEDATNKIRTYVNNCLHRKFEVCFDPYSQSIKEIDSLQKLEQTVEHMKSELLSMSNALQRLKQK